MSIPRPKVESSTRGGRVEWIVTCPDEERICRKQQFKDPEKKRAVRAYESHDKSKHRPERERRVNSEKNRKKQERQLKRRLDRELSATEMRMEISKQKEEIREREEAIVREREGWNTGNKKIRGLYTPDGYTVGGVRVPPGQNVNGLVRDANGKRVTRRMMGLDDD